MVDVGPLAAGAELSVTRTIAQRAVEMQVGKRPYRIQLRGSLMSRKARSICQVTPCRYRSPPRQA